MMAANYERDVEEGTEDLVSADRGASEPPSVISSETLARSSILYVNNHFRCQNQLTSLDEKTIHLTIQAQGQNS
jgi:hypothetical protein